MKSFIIATQATVHHEWLTFSSWYSIHRNMPEAKVGVIFPRNGKTFQYTWLRKCGVPFVAYPADGEQSAIRYLNFNTLIPDHVMVVRSDGEIPDRWTPATEDEPGTFIDVSRVGKFNLAEWVIKEKSHPFHVTSKLLGRERTVNEQKVISLWRQMASTFDFINRP